jgi:ammonia channel protein AmtB
MRVGGLTGAVAGVLLTVALGMRNPWVAIICAVIGGTAGYLSEKRKQHLS